MRIAKAEIDKLLELNVSPDDRVLSVYLDVDQSRQNNLNRHHLTAFKVGLRTLEQDTPAEHRAELQRDAAPVLAHLSKSDVHGSTLVVFSNASAGFFWTGELRVPLETGVHWDEKPYVRPLVEALDEYERIAIVLLDHEQARMFTVHLGEIEEHREIAAPDKRKQPGNEARTQIDLQRKDDEYAHRHYREVADALDKLAAKSAFGRLVLAGPRGVTSDLQSVLSKRLQQCVVRSINLPVEASEQDVLREARKIEEEIERAKESELVERLITAAHKESHGALAIEPTLDALRLGRILMLVYAEGYRAPGSHCANCRLLLGLNGDVCPYCSGELKRAEDIVSRIVETVVQSGGQAENVRGPAADRLKQAGGIGAFLRF